MNTKKANTKNMNDKSKAKPKVKQKETKNTKTGKTIIKIIVTVILVLVIILGASKAYQIGYDLFSNDAMDEEPGKEVIVNIPDNATKEEVAEILEYNGLIDDVSKFKLRCIIYEAEFHEGTYTLYTSMTTEEILDELRYKFDTEEETQETETEAESTTNAEGEE